MSHLRDVMENNCLTEQDGVDRASDGDNHDMVLFLFEFGCNPAERFLNLGFVELRVNGSCSWEDVY